MQQLQIPPLAEGETYIGAIGNQSGDVYHLILLAGDNERVPHQQQLEWAKSIGGDLPNKLEAAMLFAHAKEQFQPEAYWTNETFIDPDDPEDDGWAWFQTFYYGYQLTDRKHVPLRARAVRRLPI
jgi:hypothetical protein